MNSQKEITIQKDSRKTDFVEKYVNFIKVSVYKATDKAIRKEDEEFEIALQAFNEAVMAYDESKGDFYDFAEEVIYEKLTGETLEETVQEEELYEEEEQIPEEELLEEDEPMEEDVPEEEFYEDISVEIEELGAQLKRRQIYFSDLVNFSPKSKKAKNEVFKAIEYIVDNRAALDKVLDEGIVPVNKVLDNTSVSRDCLDKHRKYIIAAVMILTGNYPQLAEYLYGVEGA